LQSDAFGPTRRGCARASTGMLERTIRQKTFWL
jgi:hypothetical protein